MASRAHALHYCLQYESWHSSKNCWICYLSEWQFILFLPNLRPGVKGKNEQEICGYLYRFLYRIVWIEFIYVNFLLLINLQLQHAFYVVSVKNKTLWSCLTYDRLAFTEPWYIQIGLEWYLFAICSIYCWTWHHFLNAGQPAYWQNADGDVFLFSWMDHIIFCHSWVHINGSTLYQDF